MVIKQAGGVTTVIQWEEWLDEGEEWPRWRDEGDKRPWWYDEEQWPWPLGEGEEQPRQLKVGEEWSWWLEEEEEWTRRFDEQLWQLDEGRSDQSDWTMSENDRINDVWMTDHDHSDQTVIERQNHVPRKTTNSVDQMKNDYVYDAER